MSKFCPILGQKVVYLVCQECEDRVCEKQRVTILPKREKAEPANTYRDQQNCEAPTNTSSETTKKRIPGAIGFTNPTQTGERGPHPACETCCHKTGESTEQLFGITHVTYCEIHRNLLLNSEAISWEGCQYHNMDLSHEKICMNCDCYLGGGDWGLACSANYHALPTPLSKACEQFKPKSTDN
jgi:hypothetical protein